MFYRVAFRRELRKLSDFSRSGGSGRTALEVAPDDGYNKKNKRDTGIVRFKEQDLNVEAVISCLLTFLKCGCKGLPPEGVYECSQEMSKYMEVKKYSFIH